jgi:peptidoglycan/LPS O-acetylase OafA/YrhL
VLAFHLAIPWAAGGYLGVSVFFTLSGFLITSLLLAEHARDGRVAVRAFYVRRIRRLLPASAVCLAAVTALLAGGIIATRAGARNEILSGAFDVANWHALLGHHSYADLFRSPGPLDHFWSLAIEEQFYVVWPLALWGVLAWAHRRRETRSPTVVLAVLFGVSALAAPLTAMWWSADAAYYASWARFAEILAGAVLASVVVRGPLPRWAAALAPSCLAVIVLASVLSPSASGWAYAGGLPLFSLVSAGLIAGLQLDGPVRTMLSWRPLVRLGAISYGVYLFHWPVFVVLDERRMGYGGIRLDALRVAVTMAIACASYALVERPVRSRTPMARPVWTFAGAGAVLMLVAAGVMLVPVNQHNRTGGGRPVVLGAVDAIDAVAQVAGSLAGPGGIAAPPASAGLLSATESPGSLTTQPPAPTSPYAPFAVPPGPNHLAASNAAPQRRVRTVAVFGDSVPDWLVKDAAPSFTRKDVVVIDAAHEACDGMVGEPPARGRHGENFVPPPSCQPWPVQYPPVVENHAAPVDVAVLMVGQAPTVDRFVDGRWIGPCDGTQWYMSDVEARLTYLRAHAGQVVLVLPSWGGDLITWFLPDDHATRYACIRDAMRDVARRTKVPTIDLADALCPAGPTGACNDTRELDGLHIDVEDAPAVLQWLLERLPPEPWHESRLRDPRDYVGAPNPWLVGPFERLDSKLPGVAPG